MAFNLQGQTVGGYEIVEKIGQGGMATVYKAYQPSMDRHVAVKVLPQYLAQDPQFQQRFAREARTIARLEHKNILPVYDYGEDRGVPYLAMRYLKGESLKAILDERSVELEEAARIIEQVCSALDYAHRKGVIHRDVKPANILLDEDGEAYLMDFGIAKVLRTETGRYSEAELTSTGTAVGTPTYMAPEQTMGQPVDARSDTYALGVILYEMVVGRVPYEGDTPLSVALKHVNDPLPPPTEINSAVPFFVEQVLIRALSKSPDDRFQKAGDLAKALNDAIRAHRDRAEEPTAIELPPARRQTKERDSRSIPRPATTPASQRPAEPPTARRQRAQRQPVQVGGAAPPPQQPVYQVQPRQQAQQVAPQQRPPRQRRRRRGLPGWLTALLVIAVLATIGVGIYFVLEVLPGLQEGGVAAVEPTEEPATEAPAQETEAPAVEPTESTEEPAPAETEPPAGEPAQPTDEPTPQPPTEEPLPYAEGSVLLLDDFEDNDLFNNGWLQWPVAYDGIFSIEDDGTGNKVVQLFARSTWLSFDTPATAWTDYVVEVRGRVVDVRTSEWDPGIRLAFRSDKTRGGCQFYAFGLNINNAFMVKDRDPSFLGGTCGVTTLFATDSVDLNVDEWYTLRVEVYQNTFRGYVNGELVGVGEDFDFGNGYVSLISPNDMTIWYDDVRIVRLIPD